MIIELIKPNEIEQTAKMCRESALKTMPAFYAPSVVEDCINNALSDEAIRLRASWTHFYVAKIDSKIVGCGAIGPFWGSETESSLFTIFVDPNFQKQGIGREIVKVLESDEFAKRSTRIQIPASITAIPFYKKMGYEHKNGVMTFIDGHFELEKFLK